MSKHCRQPTVADVAGIVDCLFHRCELHIRVPQLNDAEEQTGSECGACLGEEVAALKAILDAAVTRLNLLQAGAGDALLAEFEGEDDDDDGRTDDSRD